MSFLFAQEKKSKVATAYLYKNLYNVQWASRPNLWKYDGHFFLFFKSFLY